MISIRQTRNPERRIRMTVLLLFGWTFLVGLLQAQDAAEPVAEAPTAEATPAPTEDDLSTQQPGRQMSRRERLELHRQMVQQRLDEVRVREEEQRRQEAQEREQAQQAQQGQPAEVPVDGGSIPAPPAAAAPATSQQGLPSVRMDAVYTVLMSDPLDLTMNEGDRVALDYKLLNRRQAEIDEITLALEYPPYSIQPVAVYADLLGQELLAGRPEVFLDERLGYLTIRIRLAAPTVVASGPVAQVVWESRGAMRATTLRWRMKGPWATSVRLGEQDRLGVPDDPTDGVIPTVVQVRPTGTRLVVEPTLDGGYISGRFATRDAEGEITLRLTTTRYAILEGEIIAVRCLIDNPGEAGFDTVSVVVAWDPEVLEAVDDDLGNRIRRGINANDSSSRDVLPLDHLLANEADNKAGRLVYRAAGTKPLHLHEGELFTLMLRGKKPAPATVVRLVHATDETRPGDVVTQISSLKRDLLHSLPAEEAAVFRVVADPRPPEVLEAQEEAARIAKAADTTQQLIETQESQDAEAEQGLEVPIGDLIMIDASGAE